MARQERPHRPRVDGRYLVLWALAVLAVATMLVWYRHVGALSERGDARLVESLISEGSSVLGAGLLFFPLRALVYRLPLRRGRVLARLPAYVAAVIVFSALHTTWNWGVRTVLFPLADLGPYRYGEMPLPYLMELPVDAILVALMASAVHLRQRLEAARRHQVEAERLQAGLARAQLDNLRLRLQPHFLFNALNTVSAVMYDDPARADAVLDRLGELLRASLRQQPLDEVPLAEELAVLDAYLEITRARFGDRLEVEVAVPDGLADLRVPPMLLQPVVENAIRHGRAERDGRGRIRVGAWREADRLELEVWDDGDGAGAAHGSGLGLAATRERLELLYGDAARLDAGPGANGGFAVRFVLPARTGGDG